MTDYKTWCQHYGYDPDSPDARREYQEAQDALAALMAASDRKAPAPPRNWPKDRPVGPKPLP